MLAEQARQYTARPCYATPRKAEGMQINGLEAIEGDGSSVEFYFIFYFDLLWGEVILHINRIA